jgi:hypothetical protein
MTKLPILIALAFSTTAACTSSSPDIVDTQLAGTVAGQAWTFQAGHTSAFLSEGEDDFFASLYPMAFTACGFSEPSGAHLIVSIPKQPGDYEMGSNLNMTFVTADSDNLVTFDGRIIVDEVTATHVTGGLFGSYDGDNEVNGRFDVTICAE